MLEAANSADGAQKNDVSSQQSIQVDGVGQGGGESSGMGPAISMEATKDVEMGQMSSEIVLETTDETSMLELKEDNNGGDGANDGWRRETLRKALDIQPCNVSISDLEMKGQLGKIDLFVNRGELVFITGPPGQKKRGASLLMQLLSGRSVRYKVNGKLVKGQVKACGKEKQYDLLRMKSPLLIKKTVLYRKLKPLEAIHMALILNGFLDNEERRRLIHLINDEFRDIVDIDQILSSRIHVGDRDVNEGNVKFGRNICCQFKDQMDAIERRKLEFITKFIAPHRPDIFCMIENKDLVYHEMDQFAAFLKQVCKGDGSRLRTTMFVRVKNITGRLLDLCDKLIILSEDKTVYVGPPAGFKTYVDADLKYEVSWSYSVLEYVLDMADRMLVKDPNLDHFQQVFLESDHYQQNLNDLANGEAETKSLEIGTLPTRAMEKRSNCAIWFIQMYQFFKRDHRNYVRTPGLTTLRGLMYIVFAIMTLVIASLGLGGMTTEGHVIWLLIAAFDFSVAASLFGMYALRLNAKTMFAEYDSGRVYLSAYHVGGFIASLLGNLYITVIPSFIYYYGLQFYIIDPGVGPVFRFVTNFWLLILLCESLWNMVALTLPQKKNATIMASFFALAFVLGQGIFTKMANLPANRYVLFVTLFRPAMNTFFANYLSNSERNFSLPQQWTDDLGSQDCWVNPQSDKNWTSKEILSCLNVTVWSGRCPVEPIYGTRWTGDEVLKCLGYPAGTAGYMAIVTVAILFFVRILTYAINKYQVRLFDKVQDEYDPEEARKAEEKLREEAKSKKESPSSS